MGIAPSRLGIDLNLRDMNGHDVLKKWRLAKVAAIAHMLVLELSNMSFFMRFTRQNSCSVVGSGGETGCTQTMLREWWAERSAIEATREP